MRVPRRGVVSDDARVSAFGGGEVIVGQRHPVELRWQASSRERCGATVTVRGEVATWDELGDQTITVAQYHPSSTI